MTVRIASATIHVVDTENNETATPTNFRRCPQCGQPTPNQLPECIHCGTRSLPFMVQTDQARAEERFIRAFISRGTPLTYAILIFNLIVYVLMAVAADGGVVSNLLSISGVDMGTLIAFGAKTNELIHQGEWFRLVTPIFIHIGWLHLASNSYVLWNIGPHVERLYGSARFMLLYLLTGVGGVIGSYLGHLSTNDPSVPSAGASGAIFGLLGVLAVFGYKYRRELPPAFRRAFGFGVLPMIGVNLLIGYTVPFIDNSAHIGGLIIGAVLALAVPYIAPGKERTTVWGLVMLAACIAVVTYSFARAYQKSAPYLAQRGRSDPRIVRNLIDKMNQANTAIVEALNAQAPDSPPDTRQQTLQQIIKAVNELDAAVAPDERTENIRRQLLQLMRKQQTNLRAATPPTAKSLSADIDAFNQINNQFREWVQTEGPKYGLRIKSGGRQ